jgi:hypothetical protein
VWNFGVVYYFDLIWYGARRLVLKSSRTFRHLELGRTECGTCWSLQIQQEDRSWCGPPFAFRLWSPHLQHFTGAITSSNCLDSFFFDLQYSCHHHNTSPRAPLRLRHRAHTPRVELTPSFTDLLPGYLPVNITGYAKVHLLKTTWNVFQVEGSEVWSCAPKVVQELKFQTRV